MNLRFNYIEAQLVKKDMRTAWAVLEALEIQYDYYVPQTFIEEVWFLGCKNVPEELPSYITELHLIPEKLLKYGISKDIILKIGNSCYGS